ncbi:MAG: hypothetical protein JJD92_11265 [Frankiaceae bacterium]|nr:hypothetical protein [Frankiaceae bacterium]
MTMRVRRRLVTCGEDAGVAILTVLLVMAVLAALSTTVTVMTINNAQNSSRDRQAGAATTIADAGIAEAVNYLRGTAGAAQALACSPSCTSNDWGSAASPHLVTVDSTRRYLVYFELIAAATAANRSTLYRVHSQGYAGPGPGARNVTVDLQYTPSTSFPIGVFTNFFDAGGTGAISNESIFSAGCVNQREHLKLTGTDAYYGVPAAVHSSGIITDTNGACSTNDNGNVHRSGPCNNQPQNGNNVDLRGDQDSLGGVLSGGMACYRYAATPLAAAGTAGSYLETSYMDTSTLTSQYNYRPGGLTPGEMDTLRAAAKAQSNYYTDTTYTIPNATTQPQAVLFFDLKDDAVGKDVDLSALKTSGYTRTVGLSRTDPACTNKQIFIVVLNGNASIQANTTFVTQLFVPSPGPLNGKLSLGGGATILGTVYADKISQAGNSNYTLDDCFLGNLNGNQFSITLTNFREVDR